MALPFRCRESTRYCEPLFRVRGRGLWPRPQGRCSVVAALTCPCGTGRAAAGRPSLRHHTCFLSYELAVPVVLCA